MSRLKEKIINKIKTEGPVTFEVFMDMALYDPELGYYMSDASRIGRDGDFYTSSHVHPVFGGLIGRQIEEMWEFMDQPADFKVIEMGSGAGYLCNDLLECLKDRPFFGALNYIIVDHCTANSERQKGLLKRFADKVTWHDSFKGLSNITGCFLSNELLDAFPVHLLQKEKELKEIYIAVRGDEFMEELGPLSNDAMLKYLKDNAVDFPEGYRTEFNLRIRDWITTISTMLAEGFVLTIDYGYSASDYYSEEGNRGTLMCYFRHNFQENPYLNIGSQDITAHVNFSSLKKWGEEAGMSTIGFCRQGAFLLALGIDEEIKKIADSSDDYLFELAKIKRLILPQGMGDSHKVMAQYKGNRQMRLKGFSLSNQMRSL